MTTEYSRGYMMDEYVGKGPERRPEKLVGAPKLNTRYRGANLRDRDLTQENLRDHDLRGADFGNSDLSGMDLSGSDFTGSYLAGANLRGSRLTNADMSFTDLTDADLNGTIVKNASFYSSKLQGADMRNTDFEGMETAADAFIAGRQEAFGIESNDVNFEGAQLHHDDFSDHDLKDGRVTAEFIHDNAPKESRPVGLTPPKAEYAEMQQAYLDDLRAAK